MDSPSYMQFFRDLAIDDAPLVGGKNASPGEMSRELAHGGVPVPNGFAFTADAYRDVVPAADAWECLHRPLDNLDKRDVDPPAKHAGAAREPAYGTTLPGRLGREIIDAYREPQSEYGREPTVAVRGSATAEDLPTASFAGQHDTFLNVAGAEAEIEVRETDLSEPRRRGPRR